MNRIDIFNGTMSNTTWNQLAALLNGSTLNSILDRLDTIKKIVNKISVLIITD